VDDRQFGYVTKFHPKKIKIKIPARSDEIKPKTKKINIYILKNKPSSDDDGL
jgi:hypothetical protein